MPKHGRFAATIYSKLAIHVPCNTNPTASVRGLSWTCSGWKKSDVDDSVQIL